MKLVSPPVVSQRTIAAPPSRRHFDNPLAKGLFFMLREGPRMTLRKLRSKRLERRVEAAQQLVVAEVRVDGRRLIGFTRLVGHQPRFDVRLLFEATGEYQPSDVQLTPAARAALESYLPVPSCPFPEHLPRQLLSANPWLCPAEALLAEIPEAAVQVRTTRRAPADARVFLLGLGGYVREYVLPHFSGEVRAALDYKAAFLQEWGSFDFPVRASGAEVMQEIASVANPLVIIATYHADHTRMALDVIAANPSAKVFIEKPPTVTATEAERLAQARAAGAWIDVGYNRRYAPFTTLLRNHIRERFAPLQIRATVKELQIPPSHWYFWENQGTRITGNACHWIDLAVHLVQSPARAVSVRTEGDATTIDTRFEDGSSLELIMTDRGDSARGVTEQIAVSVAGTTLLLDDYVRLVINEPRGSTRVRARVRDRGHERMYNSLRDRWLSGKPYEYATDDMLEVARIVEVASQLDRNGGGKRELPAAHAG